MFSVSSTAKLVCICCILISNALLGKVYKNIRFLRFNETVLRLKRHQFFEFDFQFL